MRRRDFLQGLGFTAVTGGVLARAHARPGGVRIAFGSCLDQNYAQPIWNAIARKAPDLFVFLGDNVYADTEDMNVMSAAYARLGANSDFSRFRSRIPVAATWDDHDYGCNDAGCEYPWRQESKNLMLDFFNEPKNSRRRRREGIYTSYYLGSGSMRVQVLLLDLRWFRTSLYHDPEWGYQPAADPDATLLGPQQWRWLIQELRRPAAHRVIASSVQVLSGEHRWEKWGNFPAEKERLLQLIETTGARNVTIISGDMHFGEISKHELPSGPLYDITSSGLNRFEPADGIFNIRRVGLFDEGENFGLITIRPGSLEYEVCDILGHTRIYKRA